MVNATIQVRTDSEVKSAADLIFKDLGITMSDGINIFLRQVNLHGGFPFYVKLPDSAKGGKGDSQRKEYIRRLCGKYKNSAFSTERYFDQKRREKALEK